MPVSRTRKRTSLARSPGSTMTATPPFSVNLMALPARLSSTWRSRGASPTRRRRQALVDEAGDLDALGLRARRQQFDRFLDHGGEREGPRLEVELAGLDLGEIQNLLDQRQQRFAGGLRRLGISHLLGRQRRVEQQVGHAEHAVERRADLVADHRQEARLGAIGALGLVARGMQRALGLDARRDVAADGLHLVAVVGAHRDLAPGDPARAAVAVDLLVMHAGAVGEHGDLALLAHREAERLADQARAGPCRRACRRRR